MDEIAPLTDTALLAAVHQTAFAAPWSETEFAALLEKSGARAFGTKDGFILMQKPGPDGDSEILTLAVAPAARRQGLARRLIGHACRQMQVVCVHLEVSVANQAALALYQSLGFREIGRRKAYYRQADGSRVDALLMRRAFHAG